jgi:hypothetical protein
MIHLLFLFIFCAENADKGKKQKPFFLLLSLFYMPDAKTK